MELKKERVDVNGKMFYVEHHSLYLNRPTIVFLHDSLGCVELWREFPLKLAEMSNCNLLVYDRIGYGKSDALTTHETPTDYLELEAGTLSDLLEIMEIDDVILFGHSDGGSIALIAANIKRKRVIGVICEAAHVFVENVTLEGISDAVKAYRETDLPHRLERYHGTKVEVLFRAWTETWLSPTFKDWSIEYVLPGITCPVLFIQGEADEFGTILQVTKTIAGVRGRSEKFIIPKVGHTPHKETPEKVIIKSAAFIASLNYGESAKKRNQDNN